MFLIYGDLFNRLFAQSFVGWVMNEFFYRYVLQFIIGEFGAPILKSCYIGGNGFCKITILK
jgi:hypothetical protein